MSRAAKKGHSSEHEAIDVEETRLGNVHEKGMFHVKKRGWALVFEHDAITIPKPGVRIGDTLAFVSPTGVAYEARIVGMGTANMGDRPRAMEFWLDGEGQFLNEVQPGWAVYLSAWSR